MTYLKQVFSLRKLGTIALVIGVILAICLSVSHSDGSSGRGSAEHFRPYSFSSAKVTPPGTQLVTPSILPASDGLSPGAGWTLVGSSADSMYVTPTPSATTGSGENSTTTTSQPQSVTANATSIGLHGSVYQLWVPTAAITMFGTLGNGLELPLPPSYTDTHQGPNEITVQVFSFNSSSEATSLYSNPNFSDSSMNSQEEGFTALSGTFIDGGNAASYQSDALAGLDAFEFQWTSDGFWVQVSVRWFKYDVGASAIDCFTSDRLDVIDVRG